MATKPDPYATLGVKSNVSKGELRAAYRRLVQLTTGSQRRLGRIGPALRGGPDAYARVRALRASRPRPQQTSVDPRLIRCWPRWSVSSPRSEQRERAAKAARAGGEGSARARRGTSARPAGGTGGGRARGRASPTKSFATSRPTTAAKDLRRRLQTLQSSDRGGFGLSDHVFKEGREHHVAKRVADLLDELGSKLTGEPPDELEH